MAMQTIECLKKALKREAEATSLSPLQSLSDAQYCAGFEILTGGSQWATYQEFIIPQLVGLLSSRFGSRSSISVLEIGPGSATILGYLPGQTRQKIKRYTAFEPNIMFARMLQKNLVSGSGSTRDAPLPCLNTPPTIHCRPFAMDLDIDKNTCDARFDVVLFCHSLYGMKPKHKFIESALELLEQEPPGGMVVAFHRAAALDLGSLVCCRTASFPVGVIQIRDDDQTLDEFAPFVAGGSMNGSAFETLRAGWRQLCRVMGHRGTSNPGHLSFAAPNIMMAFNSNAACSLPELLANVPLSVEEKTIKNAQARRHRPACVVKPTHVQHVQLCVQWALKHGVGLTVTGGAHSDHSLWTNVVAVDMDCFNEVHALPSSTEEEEGICTPTPPLLVAGSGCRTGDIIHAANQAGLTVPLGSRPSVGAGSWVQGGIGHLARQHGLASDAIVGVVMVSASTGQIIYVGHVPRQCQPRCAVRPGPEDEADLLWAMQGAGSNFGIVVSIIWKAEKATGTRVRQWIFPLQNELEARRRLWIFDEMARRELPRNYSADAYLYWESEKLHLGVTVFESIGARTAEHLQSWDPKSLVTILGPENSDHIVDGVGLFDTEMYMAAMHGGLSGGKTSSFKRCVFLQSAGDEKTRSVLVEAVSARPLPLCYLHLLHGGGAASDKISVSSAFGCRDWNFACVITAVWPRDQDQTGVVSIAMQWVYDVVDRLLRLTSGKGVYGADLGPDPRDIRLAAQAFGPNGSRLARLKQRHDPHRVLAYACPLPFALMEPKLIVLVTGKSCAGKDYCADIWASVLSMYVRADGRSPMVRVVSISHAAKREYAAARAANLRRLLWDRSYKEEHRAAMTEFFDDQVRQHPHLPEDHFLGVVNSSTDADVLFITGMREKAPVATLSHRVPGSRLIEIRVEASSKVRQVRRGRSSIGNVDGGERVLQNLRDEDKELASLDYCSRIFHNDMAGDEAPKRFASNCLVPFLHEDIQRLAGMVSSVANFPDAGIHFRHVLDIPQQLGGLSLCTSLLEKHCGREWSQTGVVACCEAGGFIFASALASRVHVPLALIRQAGKLPPPVFSSPKTSSHISSHLAPDWNAPGRIEIGQHVVPLGTSVLVVDDVLATGKTLCAILHLLVHEAGLGLEDISVITLAEFPAHRGRERLCLHGFGQVDVRSLLVLDGI